MKKKKQVIPVQIPNKKKNAHLVLMINPFGNL